MTNWKSIRAWGLALLFTGLFSLAAAGVYLFDQRTPVYLSGSVLTPTASHQISSVHGALRQPDGSLQITIPTEQRLENIALLISNSAFVTVYQNGEQLYSRQPQESYQRAQIIELNPLTGSDQITITFAFGYRSSDPARHLLIGDQTQIIRKQQLSLSWNAFSLGILTLASLSGIILFLRKRSETYLFHLTLACLLSLLNLSLTFDLFMPPASYATITNLRPGLLALSVTEFYQILRQLYPRRTTIPAGGFQIAALLLGTLIFCGWAPPYLAYYFRWLLLIPILKLLFPAVLSGSREAAVILTAYALMEGTCLISYIATNYFYYGEAFAFYRLIELAQAVFLITVTGIVWSRFAERFSQSSALQAQLAELNATLETKVGERTAQLQEQQRRRQTTMQNIFHDLRSPIHVLQIQVGRLPDLPEVSEIRDALQLRLNYMKKLTEELFLVANLESNNVIFDEDEVDLASLLKRVSAAITPQAATRGIHVICRCETLFVWGDGIRLEQAVQNLADNALIHTQESGVIQFTLRSVGEMAEIIVVNTGGVITQEEIGQVFERYYRSQRRRNPQSSGLGLSIAKEIVEAHQGTINVQSSLESGTRFTIRLPLLESENQNIQEVL